MEKILIRTPNWLGDCVMSIPTVKGIKKIFPDSQVYVLSKPNLVSFWELIPEVEGIIEYKRIDFSFIHSIRKHKFTKAFVLPNSWEAALGIFLSGIPGRIGYSIRKRKWMFTDSVPVANRFKNIHEVDYFLGLIEGLSGEGLDSVPQIDVSVSMKARTKELLHNIGWREDGEPIVGIHATASYGPAKCWLPERFTELIKDLKKKYNPWIIVCGSKEECKGIEGILGPLTDKKRVINIAGKTNLVELAGFLSLCKIFISNDSGPMHLASSIGTPVVAVFGSTDWHRTGPRGRHKIVSKQIECSPCFHRTCNTNLECMRAVAVSDVMKEVDFFWNEGEHINYNLKVALVMKDYDENKGGAERYLVNIAHKMAEKGVSISLIVNKFAGQTDSLVKVYRRWAIGWSSILKPLTFNWSVQQFLYNRKYDIVYGLTQIYPQDVYRVGGGLEHSWLEIRYPLKWKRILNALRPKIALRLYMENRIFQKGNFKKIITNSWLVKNQILSRYPVSPEDVRVVYNGVDKDKFSPDVKKLYSQEIREQYSIPAKAKVVLFVSNNWKRKGLVELIKAVGILRNPDIWILVVGRGRKEVFNRIVEESGMESNIIFAGPVKDPWKYYGASNICVLPTYYDPFANVCLEALSCGVPVITTKTNGASEIICHSENGYVVDNASDIRKISKYINVIIKEDKFTPLETLRPDKSGQSLTGFTLEKQAETIAESVGRYSIKRNVENTLQIFSDLSQKEEIDKSIIVSNGYREILGDMNLFEFETIMDISDGQMYKKNKLRSVHRIEYKGKAFFLKRHFSKSRVSWAWREWQNIYKLRALGIGTMDPVALGQRNDTNQSFLITKSLEENMRLEDCIPSYCSGKLNSAEIIQKRMLIKELAHLASKLHDNNLFHKDFYSGHIFLKRKDNAFNLKLIDLQRLCSHNIGTDHWRVKDLASLNFSCPDEYISSADRLRFLKHYLGEDRFRKYKKKYFYKVKDKTEKIEKHTVKLLAKRGK